MIIRANREENNKNNNNNEMKCGHSKLKQELINTFNPVNGRKVQHYLKVIEEKEDKKDSKSLNG